MVHAKKNTTCFIVVRYIQSDIVSLRKEKNSFTQNHSNDNDGNGNENFVLLSRTQVNMGNLCVFFSSSNVRQTLIFFCFFPIIQNENFIPTFFHFNNFDYIFIFDFVCFKYFTVIDMVNDVKNSASFLAAWSPVEWHFGFYRNQCNIDCNECSVRAIVGTLCKQCRASIWKRLKLFLSKFVIEFDKMRPLYNRTKHKVQRVKLKIEFII